MQVISAAELSRLWRDHSDRLVLIARAIGEPAEDAVQEAFVALAALTDPPDDPLGWLVKVTRNQLLQSRRRGDRRARREQLAGMRIWFQSSDVVANIDQSLDAITVTEALQELGDQEREVVVMHLWGELTFRQIAKATDRSPTTTHRLYQSALSQLQNRFVETPAQRDVSEVRNSR
ncbi:MAG: sigma-70 family RNA polymerase sigma factor [Planctomycetota bacterium]